jgi:hypothetical protein
MMSNHQLQLRARQHGVVVLLFLLTLTTAALAIFVSSFSSSAVQINRDKQTAAALAHAKEALIGFAVSDANRPGELPCPDYNHDGRVLPSAFGALRDQEASLKCRTEVAPGVIQPGWFPWERLRLADLRDGNGDRLWYVLSNDYHAGSGAVLNSATPGQLMVGGMGNVVAIIFSPGPPLDNQTGRKPPDCGIPPCGDAGLELARYLEGGNELGGGNLNYTSYPNPASGNANDRLLTITRAELMSAVEKRVASEARAALNAYHGTHGDYPFASDPGGYPANSAACDSGRASGLIPLVDGSCPAPASVGVPIWFQNAWMTIVTYSRTGSAAAKITISGKDFAVSP